MGEARRGARPAMTADGGRAGLTADPRVAEWRAKVAAARPPLTPEQLAILRPIFQPALLRIMAAKAAAPPVPDAPDGPPAAKSKLPG